MIKVVYEYKEFGNKKSLVFRTDENIFLLNKFVWINRQHLDIVSAVCPDLLQLMELNNVESVLIFTNAIVVNRRVINVDDLYIINDLINIFVDNIFNKFTILDLRSLEYMLNNKIQESDRASFLRARVIEFIHTKFHDIFVAHGGYVCLEDISIENRMLYLNLLGKCLGCKYKSSLLSIIRDFICEITGEEYRITINSINL